MKKVGNITSNKNYNPSNKMPPVPIDADEADAAMERFIRTKYTTHELIGKDKNGRSRGSVGSDETPPPLPPKTPSRFGLRAATSMLSIGSKSKKSPTVHDFPPSPRGPASPHRNKPSQVFGATVPSDSEDTEKKLASLRDMGFTDDRRNLQVLKGVNGSVERAIEALVRLGEGDGRARPTPRESSVSAARTLTPNTSSSGQDAHRPITPSTNPFDMLDMPPAQPMSSQSTGTLQNRNPYATTNPFGLVTQQSHSGLNQAFRSMSLSPPSQPLFPHHTGGMAAPAQQQQIQQTAYQQSMVPPVPPISPAYAPISFNHSQTYPQPTPPAAQNSYNPFLTTPQEPPQTLSVNTTGFANGLTNNPFTRSPTRIQSPTLNQIPEQSQQNYYTTSPAQATNPFFSQQSTNMVASPIQQNPAFVQQQYQQPQQQQQSQLSPFFQTTQQPTYEQQVYGQFQQQQQQQQAAQAPRADKASIMALFGQPPASSNPFQASQQPQQIQPQQVQAQQVQTPNPLATGNAPNGHQLFHAQTFPLAAGQPQYQQQQQQQQQYQAQPPAPVPNPLAAMASNNPFMATGGRTEAPQSSFADNKHKVSRDSMMALGMEWSNGRHSPDAFTSLSARDLR